jgi:putative ABC transport system permease protein
MVFVVNSTSITNCFQLFFKTSENVQEKALEFLRDNWKQVDPVAPFSYFFMEENYRSLYSKEIKISKTLTASTMISLFLLLMGIISVSLLVSASKVNDMAIMRILGAGTKSILKIFLKEYMAPFIAGSCLAIPLVYLILNGWLSRYINRTQIGLDVFLIAIAVIIISLLIVSSLMTYKVISDNPVNNLRYE